MLIKINKEGELKKKWWYQKKIQTLIKNYNQDYCILNQNKSYDLAKIINNA